MTFAVAVLPSSGAQITLRNTSKSPTRINISGRSAIRHEALLVLQKLLFFSCVSLFKLSSFD